MRGRLGLAPGTGLHALRFSVTWIRQD